jgi:hypothetical protein
VVRQLIKSGIPLTLGVEPRFLTVFFSDLENFSSLRFHPHRYSPNSPWFPITRWQRIATAILLSKHACKTESTAFGAPMRRRISSYVAVSPIGIACNVCHTLICNGVSLEIEREAHA